MTKAAILAIAGTDPSGGAGIQADIKAISATGGYAASVITALVAQNTQKVISIVELSKQFINEQLEAVFSDIDFKAVKIGMLYSQEVVEVIALALSKQNLQHVVLDPVMIAKNGTSLLLDATVKSLKEKLLPQTSLLTPNIPEAEVLLNRQIETEKDMVKAAKELAAQYGINVLVKGGHFASNESSDVLYLFAENQTHWFSSSRINTKNTHGTGCTLSSAIASYLGQDFSYIEAIEKAKNYLTKAILAGSEQQIGQGNGPVDHFYFIEGKNNG